MKKQVFLLILLSAMTIHSYAYTERNLLQKTTNVSELRSFLIPNRKWVPYPAYSDRAGWDKLIGDWKSEYIKRGEAKLNYVWKNINATDYLEFERSGNRIIMENPYFENRSAFADLLMAELAEGKGRFVDQIINGVFYYCEMTTWALSAHTVVQSSTRSLPTLGEDVFDLFAGDMGSLLSWTYYFLNGKFNEIDPEISRRLRYELQHRLLDTLLNGHFGWMAENSTTGINNWNPWCNFNALACFALLEDDMDTYAKGVYKTMVSVDKFINYTNFDGACEEGPSYWNAAAGKMYDYLNLLYYMTGGKVNIFDDEEIKNMGEYIAQSYAGNGWVVNFADAPARGGGNPSHIYRYGKAVNSPVMMSHAVYLKQESGEPLPTGSDITRNLEACLYRNEFSQYAQPRSVSPYTWYPQTQFCYIRDGKGLMLAAKGGHNAESHNHNDVGNFILYKDNVPVIIDAGVGTYMRQTFGPERYTIWTMQSDYHNLPKINGVSQKDGAEFKAATAVLKSGKTFSVDIATAYPPEAAVKSWMRSYNLSNNVLKISDQFALEEAKSPNQINFMTWGNVDTSVAGIVSIEVQGKKMSLTYDKNTFDCTTETIKLDDKKLSNVWGSEVHRISLTAKSAVKSGKYSFTIK